MTARGAYLFFAAAMLIAVGFYATRDRAGTVTVDQLPTAAVPAPILPAAIPLAAADTTTPPPSVTPLVSAPRAPEATTARSSVERGVGQVTTTATRVPNEPAGLDRCELMEWHADRHQLPDFMDWVGFGESSCRNTVVSPSGCCWGYWQVSELHVGADYTAHCNVAVIDDMVGADFTSRAANTCMAAAVLAVQGPCAWVVYANRTGEC